MLNWWARWKPYLRTRRCKRNDHVPTTPYLDFTFGLLVWVERCPHCGVERWWDRGLYKARMRRLRSTFPEKVEWQRQRKLVLARFYQYNSYPKKQQAGNLFQGR